MGQFLGSVELTPLDTDNGRNWQVDDPFDYKSSNGDIVHVQQGFVTDLASIPRALWIFWPPEGLYTEAAVVHDEAYTQQIFTRARCDDILYEAMVDLGCSWWTRHVIWWGVRVGGWYAWNEHAKHNSTKLGG